MKVSLSVGNYATNPFYLEGLGLRVYCAEELCYCLKENAFLLDMDLMSDRLVSWLRQECGLGELADELYPMVHRKGSLSVFVIRILEYVGFYDLEVLKEVERTLKKGAGLSALEKRAMRIDQLLGMRKYVAAITEYDALLSVWDEANTQGAVSGAGLKAKLLHNKGIALAGLMRYEQAAESFFQAFEQDGSMESLRCFLVAKRMGMKTSDYVSLVARIPECKELTLQLEKEIEYLNRTWEQEADYQRLLARPQLRDEDERGYLEETMHMLGALKDNYRSQAAG